MERARCYGGFRGVAERVASDNGVGLKGKLGRKGRGNGSLASGI